VQKVTRFLVAISVAGVVAIPWSNAAHAGTPPQARSGLGHLQLTLPLARAHAAGQDLLGLGLPVDIPLQYNGGPVEGGGSVSYAIFWEPSGSGTVSGTYHSLVERYFTDVGGSNFYGLMSQYSGIANSSSLGGAVVDTTPYPAGTGTLSDTDIQNEVSRAMVANGWTGGIGHEFFVFTPKGVNSCMASGSCSFSTFCAYHNFFSGAGGTVLYADMPYAGTDLSGCGTPTSPNSDADADAEISIISHEHFETVTDPTLTGWFDLLGNEIGDKCRATYGPTSGGADVTLNGNPYIVQQEYSNRAGILLGACALS
jgi:hypothetical protein